MADSGILLQVIKVEKVSKNNASHFALFNGSQLRYLIDLNGGKKKLSGNISTYSMKLGLLMKWIYFFPLSYLEKAKLGYFVNVKLHPYIEECRKNTGKINWNMIIGTYDEKQKLVLQCFNKEEEAVFVKVGNSATEVEMRTEYSFLYREHQYQSFDVPVLIENGNKTICQEFNIQVTKEFHGSKVAPILNEDIIRIYREISSEKRGNLTFSHGDFAPWNLKKVRDRYILFDWEHCGYRMEGFDLMHYAIIIENVINGKDVSDAIEIGLLNIKKYIPEFSIDKAAFLDEYKKLRMQIV